MHSLNDTALAGAYVHIHCDKHGLPTEELIRFYCKRGTMENYIKVRTL